ncbi:MAG: ribulose-phosphate 3-epimerase [Opitutales bacterium]
MTSLRSPHPFRLAPSILAGDHAELGAALRQVETHPIEWLHLDIMDGHFVPNLSFGPATVAALRKRNAALFFDVHLMLSRPDNYIEAFAEAGADGITIHLEPDYDVAATLEDIRARGLKTGLALNPGTDAAAVEPYLEAVDLVLVMTVWPGFGGQSFIPETIAKMEQLARWRAERGLAYRLEVDGGIDLQTAPRCAAAGVDTFVAGTAFFKAPDPAAFVHGIESPGGPS